MTELGADPARIVARTGPAVCGRCYEVPEQMRSDVAAVEPAAYAETSWGTPRSTSSRVCTRNSSGWASWAPGVRPCAHGSRTITSRTVATAPPGGSRVMWLDPRT